MLQLCGVRECLIFGAASAQCDCVTLSICQPSGAAALHDGSVPYCFALGTDCSVMVCPGSKDCTQKGTPPDICRRPREAWSTL
eukprot:1141311-Pelagomonas_calceolata.AAC.3